MYVYLEIKFYFDQIINIFENGNCKIILELFLQQQVLDLKLRDGVNYCEIFGFKFYVLIYFRDN